ncbi:hypothetical protein [Christiangramia aquimixticola]|uniref:hypothetical protein n=1 Tax=Christiangramia aquimixticola TaxID=1697558 RepID=UPI003AA99C23
MKNSKISFLMLLSMLCFISCSKEEAAVDKPEQTTNKVTLSFDAALKLFAEERAKENLFKYHGEDEQLPVCPEDETPKFILAVIEKPGGGFVDDGDAGNGHAVKIPVINNPTDSDNDGLDNWLTYEMPFMELDPGTYKLLYFAVHNDDGIMWLAPSEDDDYGPANFENFVDNPLPHDIDLVAGTKHYDKVEVLCYDPHFAKEYGYLFFDFEMVPLTYVCFFGNECDETGRHFPSHFKVIAWEHDRSSDSFFDIVTDISEALVEESNTVEYDDAGNVVRAEPLCIPLPDRDGENSFYVEIWALDEAGNMEGDEPMRQGIFTDEMVKSGAFDIEDSDLKKYWHFREGPYCGQDSDPCLLSAPQESLTDFNNGDFSNTGNLWAASDYQYVAPGPNALWPEGTFTFTSNPNDVHSHFINEDNGSKMFVINGSTEAGKDIYMTFTCSDVCPNTDYYITFMTKSVVSSSPAELKGFIDMVALPGTINVNDDWQKVGLWVKSDNTGSIKFHLEDANTAAGGNDFAIEDIILSTSPYIMFDIDQMLVQP